MKNKTAKIGIITSSGKTHAVDVHRSHLTTKARDKQLFDALKRFYDAYEKAKSKK